VLAETSVAETCSYPFAAVLDGTVSTCNVRCLEQQLATHPRSRFLAVQCVCIPDVGAEQIQRRLVKGREASDERPELAP
jgi:predicted kinase